MFNKNIVAAIQVNGKLIKEENGKVNLPFGCEYSIYLRNISNKKVSINIDIDGEDILDGSSILLYGKEEIKLERFVDNMKEGQKFRFIEMTSDIESFRGNKIEDSLINITYRFEKEIIDFCGSFKINQEIQTFRNNTMDMAINSTSLNHSLAPRVMAGGIEPSCNEKGITVKGSASKQSFKTGYIGELEYEKNNIVFELFGYQSVNGIEPLEYTIIEDINRCPSCGSIYDTNREYCSQDGTFLVKGDKGINISNLSFKELKKISYV